MSKQSEKDDLSPDEVERRSEAALKRLLSTPHQPRVKTEVKEGESKKRGRPPTKAEKI